MDSIISCDFFTKNVYTVKGKFAAYSIVFIHYATRRVYVSPPTFNPDDEWLMQQARNVSMWLEDENINMRYFIRDHDGKFSKKFDTFFEKIISNNNIPNHNKGKVIKTAIRCPWQNGYVEAWIGRFKFECLNSFVCFSLEQLSNITSQYAEFFNNYRPHQSKDNKILNPDFSYPANHNICRTVKRQKKVFGLLSHYYIEEKENEIKSA
jgi:putative transposase